MVRMRLLNCKATNRQKIINDFFKSMDRDFSKMIEFKEFKQGIRDLGLKELTDTQMKCIFNEFDLNKDGKIEYAEFIQVLQPSLSPLRKKVLDDAFNKIDYNKDGVLSIEDFRHVYFDQAKNHPNCLQGKWTIDQVIL